jgi:glutamate formiminotransferase
LFFNGLTKEDVSDFLKIIAKGIEGHEGCNDIALAMNEAGIAHISVETIDYDRFCLIEVTEIVAFESPKKTNPQISGTNLSEIFFQNSPLINSAGIVLSG